MAPERRAPQWLDARNRTSPPRRTGRRRRKTRRRCRSQSRLRPGLEAGGLRSREGKKGVLIHVSPQLFKQLQQLALAEDTPVHALGMEAFEAFLARRRGGPGRLPAQLVAGDPYPERSSRVLPDESDCVGGQTARGPRPWRPPRSDTLVHVTSSIANPARTPGVRDHKR